MVGAYRIRHPNAIQRIVNARNVSIFQVITIVQSENASHFQVIRSIDGTFVGRMQYAPTLLPENMVRFLSPTCIRLTSSASVEALIFFCLLFFHQGKKRR